MTELGASASPFSLRTVWSENLKTPLRQFLRTETGSAAVLLAATVAALAWANIDPSGYAATWHTQLVIRSGTKGLADSWQGWVNSGLMAFFFLVAGLEARREFDMGELRERRRLTLPLVVALGGMVVPIAIYLAINFGRSSAPGWGVAFAYPAARSDLEQASESFRLFREQPTPELARDVRESVRTAISPNDRLQQLFHPWTSYLIVPLLALANAGITVSGSFLAHAFTSPVTLGILLGYVVGKPVGTVGAAWLLARVSRGRIRPPVGWAAVTGAGAIAGIGFIVSLLIASLAFGGAQLAEAKVGVLSAAVCASVLGLVIFRLTAMLPKRLRLRALLGTAETITDLAVPVDPEHDHVRGPAEAPVTLVEYADFECPYCGLAEPVVRELLAGYGDLRYVWRHLPLTDVHPHALLAAEGAEAAARQGKFWEMHDQLLDHQGALTARDLIRYAGGLGLDIERFTRDLRNHVGEAKIAADVDSADLSGVSGTPTFFVNGRRHHGAYDISTLSDAVRAARARVLISSRGQPRHAP